MCTLAARQRVLVAEDNALISMLVVEGLIDHGYRCVGSFSRSSDAIASVTKDNPDLAVVDIGLADGKCSELARELRKRDIPFLIYSGYTRRSEMADVFNGVPWIAKPASIEAIVSALRELESLAQGRPAKCAEVAST
jgi:DNA-binding response OmpR family regulator